LQNLALVEAVDLCQEENRREGDSRGDSNCIKFEPRKAGRNSLKHRAETRSSVECRYRPGKMVAPQPTVGENPEGEGKTTMNPKSKFILGILTAVAMFCLSFALPRGGALRDAQAAQFPMTVGVWAIFVLLFVKLK